VNILGINQQPLLMDASVDYKCQSDALALLMFILNLHGPSMSMHMQYAGVIAVPKYYGIQYHLSSLNQDSPNTRCS
jgi:hypothetical protein